MKKTLCFFSASFIPQVGGVERYVYSLASHLVRQGHTVYVVTSHLGSTPWEETIDGIQVLRVPFMQLFGGSLNTFLPSIRLRKQLRVLKSANIDAVITNTRFYLSTIYGIAFAKKNKIAAVHIEHGSGHIPMSNPVLRILGELYDHLLAGYIRRNVAHCYGVSLACAQWLKHFNIQASGVIYNGIENSAGERNGTLQDRYLFDSKTFIYSSIGRLIPEKGFETLLDAFQEVHRRSADTHLFIAGDGPSMALLRSRIDESSGVTLLGNISHDNVMDLLHQTDVFVFPSQCREGMPTVVLEAAISGCALIATPQGGTVEIVSDGDTGIIVPPGDAPTTARAMNMLYDSPTLLAAMSDRAAAHVRANFTWESIVQTLLRAVEKAMGNSAI